MPVRALPPLQPSDAVQLVAFDDDQVNVAVPPSATLPGLAARVTTGSDVAAATVTVVLASDVPPSPVQLKLNVLVPAFNVAVVSLPLAALVPVQDPDAEQLFAYAELHVKVAVPGADRLLGFAERLSVGAFEAPVPTDPPQPASKMTAPAMTHLVIDSA